MVTTVTSLGRTGLYDWFIQRCSAVVMLLYTLYLVGFILLAEELDYFAWQGLFEQLGMKVFSLLALISLVLHAWVGVWTVTTDYLTERALGSRGNWLRLTAQSLTALLLFWYLVWGIRILWAV